MTSLAQLVQRAQSAAHSGDLPPAIAALEEAVGLARASALAEARAALPAELLPEQERKALVRLSLLLYNLAKYYLDANRPEEAVRALEEVVALDERTAHSDLEADRQALEIARQAAAQAPAASGEAPPANLPIALAGQWSSLAPAEQAQLRQALQKVSVQLEGMSPEQRAHLQAAAAQWISLSPDEQQALQIRQVAEQSCEAVIAVRRGQAERTLILSQIENYAAQAAADEAPGAPWEELSQFLRALAAILKGETPPSIPAAYADELAMVLQTAGKE